MKSRLKRKRRDIRKFNHSWRWQQQCDNHIDAVPLSQWQRLQAYAREKKFFTLHVVGGKWKYFWIFDWDQAYKETGDPTYLPQVEYTSQTPAEAIRYIRSAGEVLEVEGQ